MFTLQKRNTYFTTQEPAFANHLAKSLQDARSFKYLQDPTREVFNILQV
jgi:hypothetical protein